MQFWLFLSVFVIVNLQARNIIIHPPFKIYYKRSQFVHFLGIKYSWNVNFVSSVEMMMSFPVRVTILWNVILFSKNPYWLCLHGEIQIHQSCILIFRETQLLGSNSPCQSLQILWDQKKDVFIIFQIKFNLSDRIE